MSHAIVALLEAVPDPLMIVSADGVIVRANRAFARLVETPAERLVGLPLNRFMGTTEAEVRELLDRSCRTSAPLPFAGHLRHSEGAVARCRLYGSLLERGASKSTTTLCLRVAPYGNAARGFLRLNEEITGLKREVRARQKAEQALANLAAIVTSSDDAIVGMDLHGVITSWNRAAERLYGYTAEEMIGQPVSLLIPPDRHDEGPHILGRLLRGERIDHYETVRRRKDGVELHISLTISPVVDAQGRIVGASKIARDITAQKRAEQTLRERDAALTAANQAMAKQAIALAEANNELESFSYSVSHDLRAPLRTIDAFSRIVEEDNGARLDAEGRRCLTIVRKAAAQAGELIDDLLELSRLGRQSMQLRTIDMAALARDAADDLRRLHEGRAIDLQMADLPPCHGDQRLLKLVWTNLLGNAFKYTRYAEAARVEVGWLPDDAHADAVVYYVKDNGVGFDMKYAHKLFGVFQRLHSREDFEGTGVGLAIVQRIVHRHGGRVWAEGKVDGGATFYFSLRKAAA